MHSLLSGQSFRRVGASTARGPEWHGPCPVCGGRDRFHVWPEQGDGGTWWCRACDKGGDLVEFYRWRDSLGYREACERAGVQAREEAHPTVPRPRQAAPDRWQPTVTAPVPEVWAEHAAKFVDWCHGQLLANPAQLAWLAARGIGAAMVTRYRLGHNPADAWRQREAWGLETVRKDDGSPRKLWLPAGLVIPSLVDGRVDRVRIRRPEGDPRYYVVAGSSREPMVSRWDAEAYVIVESELDAICLDGLAGDLVGVVAMGNSSARPTDRMHACLIRSAHISVCMDSDRSGAKQSRWWLDRYRQAERVPVIGGKDPGDAHKAGVDLRSWVLAGLPPRFHIELGRAPAAPVPAAEPAPQADAEQPEPGPRTIVLADGREVCLVETRLEWEALVAEGRLVFSLGELERLQAACAGMDEETRTEAVRAAVDAKELFPGAYVCRGEVAA